MAKTLNSIRSDSDHVPCVVIGIVKNETTPKVTEDEVMFTLSSSDSHRGGGMAVFISKEKPDGERDKTS